MALHKLLLGSAALLVLSFGAASADSNSSGTEKGQRVEKIFVELDVNQDGQITQEEIIVGAEKRFTTADVNGDGQLSKDEFTANMGKHGDRAFTRLDSDSDGFVTKAEMDAALADGRTMQWLQKADANGDGAITREELEAVKGSKDKGSDSNSGSVQ